MSSLSRREFLRISALTGAATVVAACTVAPAGGTAQPVGAEPTTAPPAQPAEAARFGEAPSLAEQVAAGALPAVEERLPQNPMIIPVAEEIGQYGGIWHRCAVNVGDVPSAGRLTYEAFVRWNGDASAMVNNLAESYEINDDATEYTFRIPAGMKWSDGEPFTADDIVSWYQDSVLNTDLTPTFPKNYLDPANNEPMLVEKADDHTIVFRFASPYGLFLEIVGNAGVEWPIHYLKQFHPNYTPMAELEPKIKAAGFTNWWELFGNRNTWQNPDKPSIWAWQPKRVPPDVPSVWERNPYYWKVDPDGKQLPYLDKWVHTQVEDMRVVPLRIVGGEVDFMARSITFDAFTEIKTAEEQGNYRMILWKVGGGGDPMFIFNWEHKDPEIRTLFRTREFKLGLSHALDRETINNVVYLGQGAVSQGVTSPYSPWGRTTEEGKQLMEQWRTLAIEYDVDKANAYLDDCGLDKKDADGFRLLPSGKRLVLVMITGNPPESRAVDVMEMAVEQWRAVGVDITLNVQEPAAVSERRTTADYDIDGWDAWTGYHIPTIPDTLFPVGAGYCGFRGTALWYNTKGAQGEAPTPGDPMDQLIQIYEKMIASTTDEERNKWVLEGVKIHINEGPFMLAAVNDIPNIVVARKNMLNIPPFAFTGSWAQGAPGCTHPPLYFYKV